MGKIMYKGIKLITYVQIFMSVFFFNHVKHAWPKIELKTLACQDYPIGLRQNKSRGVVFCLRIKKSILGSGTSLIVKGTI